MAQKDIKTAQIISAATDEFLAKGLQAASMQNIAEIAQVSKRTLYKYYPNKDVLYSALIDELLDRMQDMDKFKYQNKRPIRDQLDAIVQKKIELTTSNSFLNISKIVIGEILKGRSPNTQQMERMYKSEMFFIDWVSMAKADGQITSKLSNEIIGQQFQSILKGQIFYPVILHFTDIKTIDLLEVKSLTINFFINSFCKK